MNFDDYQKQAAKTSTYEGKEETYKLMYLSMGLAGESGEVIEKLKKIVRNDDGEISEEKRKDLESELGDVLWYLSQLAETLDVSLQDVAEKNIAKLADRAERGVIKSEGDTR